MAKGGAGGTPGDSPGDSPTRTAATAGPARPSKAFAHLPAERALARLGHTLKRPVFALPFYRYSLPGLTAGALVMTPNDPWPGRAEAGSAILQGRFAFAGQSLIDPAPIWAPPGAGADWLAEMHGFSWLRDLRATGGDAARRRARELVRAWLDVHPRWSMPAWEPLTCARRLSSWLGCHEFFAASAEIDFRHRLLISIAQQAQHLCRALPAGLAGADLIAAAKGLILAGSALAEGGAWRDKGLTILRRELARQILPDGGHVERSPSRHMAVLRDLIDVRGTLARARPPGAAPEAAPEDARTLSAAIEAMAPVLRMFQHGDGGLALFNGALEEDGWLVDLVLQRAGGPRRPIDEAPACGFQRLSAGRTVVVVETGAAPPRGLDRNAHAGTLSFELSAGRERLIVNCGARPDDPTWRAALRATAAHSTMVLGDSNSAEVLARGIGRGARVVHCRREDEAGRSWLDAAHDGYVRGFGATHRRRLYLSADGGDLRGEDRLEAKGNRVPGGRFALRFHLHPGVRASLAQGGDCILLRPPKGGGWQLRAAGAAIALEPSIYLGQAGQVRRGQQVVLSGRIGPDGTRVKWALRRVETKRA